MTHVFTCATILLLLFSLLLPLLAGGCALDGSTSALGSSHQPSASWLSSAGTALTNVGEAVTPFNPIVGGAILSIGGVATAVAVRRGQQIKALKQPRDRWNEAQRAKFRGEPLSVA